jgi:hypothetical protein
MKYTWCLLLVFLSSCFSELYEDYTFIDPALQPYVDNFVKDANDRGVQVNLTNFKIFITDIKGKFGVSLEKSVHIDSDFFYSYSGYSTQIEIIVYHELGHHFLNLKHDNSKPLIMSSPTNITLYNSIGRERALDDLFSQNI